MRNKRILALVLASAMAAGSVVTANAATAGWVLRGNDWYYQNAQGEWDTDVWRYDAAKTHKYFLGDDGKMLTSQLVDDNGYLYYVNSAGEMVVNEWRLLAEDGDEEERWFWFGANGRAVESGWKSINGKSYHFTDHRMDYGFLGEDGQMLDSYDSYDVNWQDAVYYVGDNSDGSRKTDTWVEIFDFDSNEYENRDSIWLWFGSNGKKAVNKTLSIGNARYTFDDKGAMVTEWYGSATPSDASYKYYDNPDGNQQSGRWFQAVPSEEQDAYAHANEELKWFYAGANGTTYKDVLRTINGKKYIFDENGIMRTGFIVVDSDNKIVEILGESEEDYPSVSMIKAAVSKGTLMYFDESGAAATSKINIELDEGKVTMAFTKAGKAIHGVNNGYLYDNGVLIKSDKNETGYKYMEYTLDGNHYLVNTAGKICKAGTYSDSDNIKWTVKDDEQTKYSISWEYKQ